MATLLNATETWTSRRRRADALAADHPHAAPQLRLYSALCEVWEPAWVAAREEGVGLPLLPEYAAARVLPGVVEAALTAGPQRLKQMAVSRFHEADPVTLIRDWLDGNPQPPVDQFLGRAAAAPVLEAIQPEAGGRDSLHCPGCGGLPQLAYLEPSGDPLLTAPRQLLCSRCSRSWALPRLVCAGCGSDDSAAQPIFADAERLPGVRADACERCHRYLLTVEVNKDPRAVPVVDEIAALPLDLYVQERGFAKITANLMGI